MVPNYPILAFHCPNIHFSIARSKTNILSYRIYESLEKIKKKKKRRNLDTLSREKRKQGWGYETIERIDISHRLV